MEGEAPLRPLTEILAEVSENLADACRRSGRSPDEVEIIAVTKTHGPDVVREAWEAGLAKFGENKVQEAAWKIPESVSGPEWHLIGHLQRNKVRAALELFSTIHSVDSVELIRRLESIASECGCTPEILLEVNVSGESSKSGFAPEAVPAAIEAALACRSLTLSGLMTMAPFVPDPEMARPVFARLRELRDTWERDFGIGLPRLSMGMSHDYIPAVEEGATWIRLGTVLFGARPTLRDLAKAQAAALL
ncbi:MAG: YggS family pyridoxal phosphate-dependent enzyme [Kiritimatiellae bacterium]|nr:YggS family pyridoxal phosphate-dependent enzyme [Kiritimatiellia bacterium]